MHVQSCCFANQTYCFFAVVVAVAVVVAKALWFCLEFSQHPLVFISGYANMENVFYCLNVWATPVATRHPRARMRDKSINLRYTGNFNSNSTV